MEMSTVISKVEKLLALGTSSNEHEAAAAMAKAQALMLEYGLEMHQVTGKRPGASAVKETDRQNLFERGKPGAWKEDLFRAVAKTSGCYPLTGFAYEHSDGKPRRYTTGWLAGLPGDVELAAYAYSFIVAELERLAQAEADKGWAAIRQMATERGISVHDAEARYTWYYSHPLKVKVSWLKGAAEGVIEQLTAAARERVAQAGLAGTELVLNREAVIRDYFSLKNYGMTWAERQADLEKRNAEWAAKNPAGVAKPLTPAQLRKQRERDEAAYRRYQRSQDAEYRHKWANVDIDAYQRGREAGRSLQTRPGVRDHTGPAEIGGDN